MRCSHKVNRVKKLADTLVLTAQREISEKRFESGCAAIFRGFRAFRDRNSARVSPAPQNIGFLFRQERLNRVNRLGLKSRANALNGKFVKSARVCLMIANNILAHKRFVDRIAEKSENVRRICRGFLLGERLIFQECSRQSCTPRCAVQTYPFPC